MRHILQSILFVSTVSEVGKTQWVNHCELVACIASAIDKTTEIFSPLKNTTQETRCCQMLATPAKCSRWSSNNNVGNL